MRLCLVIAGLLATALALPTDKANGRKQLVARDWISTRHGLQGETRTHLQSRSSPVQGGRHGPKDRGLLERSVEETRAADEERKMNRNNEQERTTDEERRTEEDRRTHEDRRVNEDRNIHKDRRAEDDRKIQEGRSDQLERNDNWDRESGIHGNPPSRSVMREPDVQGLPPQLRDIPESRGINWATSSQGEFPFMVRLSAYYQKNGAWYYEPCGASIISPKHILTAAHCFDNQRQNGGLNAARVYAYFNDFDTTISDESAIRTASSVILHPSYAKETHPVHDIAVVELKDELNFDALKVIKACLDSSEIGGDVAMTIAGWGKTAEDATAMNTQLYKSTSEKTMTNNACRAKGYTDEEIGNGVICATGGPQFGTQDACQGDSGGPMFHRKNGHFAQTGIVSWGRGCGKPDYPGIYTRVSKYTAFVAQHCPQVVLC